MREHQPLLRLERCKTSAKRPKKSNNELVFRKGGSEKKRSIKAQLKEETLLEKLLKSNSDSKKDASQLTPRVISSKSGRSATKSQKIKATSIPSAVHSNNIKEEKQISPKFGSTKAT